MFRKIVFICGVFFLLIGSLTLLNGEERRPVESGETVVVFAPLPSFNEMFSALDYLEVKEYDVALEREAFKVPEEVYRTAFALGVNTADAIIATKARNSEKLTDIAVLMMNYARFLGLSDEILRLGDELRRMIEGGQWNDLVEALERYREQVELSLYESRQYDIFTMMQLGGWTQGLNRTSYLLINNYEEKRSDIVAQKGIINSLINNLEVIRDPVLREQEYYVSSREMFNAIKDIIYSFDRVYPPEAIKELLIHTDEIKNRFR